jgi:uncharacterized membrane protein
VSLPTTRSAALPAAAPANPRALIAIVMAVAATALFTAISYGPQIVAAVPRLGFHPHAPNLALIAAQPPAVQVHLYAVLSALAVGIYLMTGRKGVMVHRILGWAWSIFMVTAAASSLLIRHGGFSFLHLFSVFVLISVPMAVYAARRHNVVRHSRTMSGAFWGGLIVAGTFAFLPGRLMWMVFFG